MVDGRKNLSVLKKKSEMFVLVSQPMKAKLVKYLKDMSSFFTCFTTLNHCINVTGVDALLNKISTSLRLHKTDPHYIRIQINSFNNTFISLFDIYARKYDEMTNTFTGVTDNTSDTLDSVGGIFKSSFKTIFWKNKRKEHIH